MPAPRHPRRPAGCVNALTASTRSPQSKRTATPLAVSRRVPDLRRQLLERRRETLARVARTEDELRWLGANIEPEAEDEAQEETATLLLARLDARGRAALAAIDRALARMADGTYGRCGDCGCAITLGRLAALPEAIGCVRCAQEPSSGPPRARPRASA